MEGGVERRLDRELDNHVVILHLTLADIYFDFPHHKTVINTSNCCSHRSKVSNQQTNDVRGGFISILAER